MTSTGMVTTAVAQARFGLADDGAVSVVASSLDGARSERGWLDLLHPHLDLPVAPGTSASALSYLTFPDGFAAVLRRARDANDPGHVHIHALLGVDGVLTPGVALSCSEWAGWRDAPPAHGQLPTLRADEVCLPDAAARLRRRALAQGDLLARSLAWMLQSPGTPLSFVGCPEEDRVALVWALREIAALRLPKRAWTFATHEDVATSPPAITFSSRSPVSAQTDRIVIDLRRDQGASPQNEYSANALVYRYEYGIDPPGVGTAPAVLSVPAPAPVPVFEPVLEAEESPAAPTRSALPAWQWAALVNDAVDARDVRALDGALAELEYAVARIDNRGDVRKALESKEFAAETVRRHVAFELRDSVFDRIVQVAFGATGPGRVTRGARADARRLAETSELDEVVRAIARANMGGGVSDALAERWQREHAPVVENPTAGLSPVGRFLWRRGLAITPAWERRLLLLVALLTSFVFGVVVHGMFW